MTDVRLLDLPPAALAIGGAALLLLAGMLSYRFWLWLLGPVFTYETARLSRQGKTVVLRCAYALALFATLYFVFPTRPVMELADLAQFANRFSQAFLIVQSIAVSLLTPIYVAGAVSDEKEHRSLDFLLATPLRSYEIVLGKLGARLLNLFGLLLAGLPILALTQLWGGIDLLFLVGGFVVTAAHAFSLGSFAILCSVLSQRTARAMFAAYAVPIVLSVCCTCLPYTFLASPITWQLNRIHAGEISFGEIERVEQLVLQSGVFVALHSLVAVFCLIHAVRELRRCAIPPEPLRNQMPPLYLPPIVDLAMPNLGNGDPLIWKEAYLGRSRNNSTLADMGWLCYGVLVISAGIIGAAVTFGHTREANPSELAVAFFALLIFPALALLAGMAYRLSGSITREREQRTLESLLVLPVTAAALLRAKWLGSLRRCARSLVVLVLMLVGGVAARVMHPLAGLLLALAIVAHAVFVANLALCLSVYSRTTLRANLALFALLLSLLIGTLLWAESDSADDGRWSVLKDLNPLYLWWQLALVRSWSGWSEYGLARKLVVLMGFAAAAALLAGAAVRRLRREARFG